jgi:hypothetical protein
MKNFLFISTSLFAFMVSCSTFTDQNELPNKMTHEQDTLKTVETKQLEYNHKVIFSPETGWGYQIFKEKLSPRYTTQLNEVIKIK